LKLSDGVVEVEELLLVVVDGYYTPSDVSEVQSIPDFAMS
jgi:hypothetical protein